MQRLLEISACFPVFNEAANIEPLIREARAVLPEVAERFEIILADDGSSDGSGELLDRLAQRWDSLKVVHGPHRGYGAALRAAFREARYERVFFSDSDRQFDLGELKTFVPLAGDCSLLIGYRHRRADAKLRGVLQRLYLSWSRSLLGLSSEVRDVNCAFKLIDRSLLQACGLTSDGALINAELLVKAAWLGCRHRQIPVTHRPRVAGQQTGASPKVIFQAACDTVSLARHLRAWRTKHAASLQCAVE